MPNTNLGNAKNGGPAFKITNKYLTGAANRQKYFETAVTWEAGGSSVEVIESYFPIKIISGSNVNPVAVYTFSIIISTRFLMSVDVAVPVFIIIFP